jgi:hypothetical protein
MDEQTPKRRRGCLFYGCLGFCILFLVILAASMAGYRYAKKMFTELTDSKPMPLPAVTLSKDQIAEVQRRVDAFRSAIREQSATAPLELTADEINALIANDPDLQELKGKLYVIIDGDQLKGQISIRMEDLGLPLFKERYFNGTGTFKLTFRDGILRITPETLLAKGGRPIPPTYMEPVRKTNLAHDLNTNPRAVTALEKLQDIRVQGGKLILTPKKKD